LLNRIDLSIIVAYLLVLISVGLLFRKRASKNLEAYFLGGRKIPWWVLGISGSFSNLDLAGTIAISSVIVVFGLKGWWIGVRGGLGLYIALNMVLIGKWARRSKKLTMAEWMELRFGSGTQGSLARVAYAVFTVIAAIAAVATISKGIGVFGEVIFGIEETKIACILIGIASIYLLLAGLYGVAYTDLIQGIVIGITCVALAFVAFTCIDPGMLPASFREFLPTLHLSIPETITGAERKSYVSLGYEFFGACLVFWFIRTFFEAFAGGMGGFTAQRFLAARNEREAGLLGLMWMIVLAIRWPFVIAVAILALAFFPGIHPEAALPTVLAEFFPTGMLGLAVAGLFAASMSTFDSVVNGGASYFVKDIYEKFKPRSREKDLVRMSYFASALIIIVGLFLGLRFESVIRVVSFCMMGLGPAMIPPGFLRWIWPRLNGYGFASGVIGGTLAAIVVNLPAFGVNVPFPTQIWITVPIIIAISLLCTLVATLASEPTDKDTLLKFYRITRPFGFWKNQKKETPPKEASSIKNENIFDGVNLCLALPMQMAFYAFPFFLMVRMWLEMGCCLAVFAGLLLVLYFTWYKRLGKR
jgi:Na+/proline symporter